MTNPLLVRLTSIFGQPDSADPKLFLAELAKQLAGYTPSELDRAGDLILRTHRGRVFPTIQFICQACVDVRAGDRAKDRPPEWSLADRNADWAPPARARADRLIQCDLGRQAAAEGWISPLWDHYRRTAVQPTASEIAAMKRVAQGFNDAYRDACRGPDRDCEVLLIPQLRRLGEMMLARRDRLSTIASEGPE